MIWFAISMLFFIVAALILWWGGDQHGYARRQAEEESGTNLCDHYEEDPAVCFDDGEPKGQCIHCGDKYYNHRLSALTNRQDRRAARTIQNRKGFHR